MDKEVIKKWLKENLITETILVQESSSNNLTGTTPEEINESLKNLQDNFDLRGISPREVISGKKSLHKIRKILQREVHDWTLSPYIEKQTFVNQEIFSQINFFLKRLQELESNLEGKFSSKNIDSSLTQIENNLESINEIRANLESQKSIIKQLKSNQELLEISFISSKSVIEETINSKIYEQQVKSLNIVSALKKTYLDLLERKIDDDAFDYYYFEIQSDRLTIGQLKEKIKKSEEYQSLLESKDVLQQYQFKIKKPIFVFGVPRTGTTLLQSILCSNENLAWFSDQDIGDWLSLEEQHQHQSFSQWLKSNNKNIPASEQTLFALGEDLGPGIKHLGIPPKGSTKIPIEGEIFWKKYLGWAYIKDMPMDTKILLTKEISKLIEIQGKERFISKAPNNSIRLFALEKLFPDAKFINVARDPREVISSMLTRYEEEGIFSPGIPIKNKIKYAGLEPIEQFAWLYKEITDAIHEFSQEHKGNFMTVRYEELISNPNETVKKLFEFTDLEIPENISEFIPKLYDTSQKWKKKLSSEDEKRIFNILEKSMEKMGYQYSL